MLPGSLVLSFGARELLLPMASDRLPRAAIARRLRRQPQLLTFSTDERLVHTFTLPSAYSPVLGFVVPHRSQGVRFPQPSFLRHEFHPVGRRSRPLCSL